MIQLNSVEDKAAKYIVFKFTSGTRVLKNWSRCLLKKTGAGDDIIQLTDSIE
jgi:hypothetical protein